MRVARYWRTKSNLYRLEGVRYDTGDVSVQARRVTRPNMLVLHRDETADEQPQAILVHREEAAYV